MATLKKNVQKPGQLFLGGIYSTCRLVLHSRIVLVDLMILKVSMLRNIHHLVNSVTIWKHQQDIGNIFTKSRNHTF